MSVKIRLRRIGRKKQPYYRLVVTDSAAPRDGAYLDLVGFYNPGRKPAELRLDLEKVDAWEGKGAELSDTVASLVRKARKGGDKSVELFPVGGAIPPEVAPPAEKPARPARTAQRAAPPPAPEPAPAAAPPEPAPAEAAAAPEPEAPAASDAESVVTPEPEEPAGA